MAKPREPKEVIDQAINENHMAAYLCLGLAVLFIVVGIVLIVWGILREQPMMGVVGSISSLLLWPSYRQIKRIGNQNMMVRLFEIPASKASTSGQAAESLTELLIKAFEPETRR